MKKIQLLILHILLIILIMPEIVLGQYYDMTRGGAIQLQQAQNIEFHNAQMQSNQFYANFQTLKKNTAENLWNNISCIGDPHLGLGISKESFENFVLTLSLVKSGWKTSGADITGLSGTILKTYGSDSIKNCGNNNNSGKTDVDDYNIVVAGNYVKNLLLDASQTNNVYNNKIYRLYSQNNTKTPATDRVQPYNRFINTIAAYGAGGTWVVDINEKCAKKPQWYCEKITTDEIKKIRIYVRNVMKVICVDYVNSDLKKNKGVCDMYERLNTFVTAESPEAKPPEPPKIEVADAPPAPANTGGTSGNGPGTGTWQQTINHPPVCSLQQIVNQESSCDQSAQYSVNYDPQGNLSQFSNGLVEGESGGKGFSFIGTQINVNNPDAVQAQIQVLERKQETGTISPAEIIELENLRSTTALGYVENLITKIIKWVLGFVGLLALVMLFYGAFLWITAAGEEDNIEDGREIMLWSAIGLAVVVAAHIIVTVVVQVFTNF